MKQLFNLLLALSLLLATSCDQKPKTSKAPIETPAQKPTPTPAPVDTNPGVVEDSTTLFEPEVVLDSTPVETPPANIPPPVEKPVVVEEKIPQRVPSPAPAPVPVPGKPNLPPNVDKGIFRPIITNPNRVATNIALAAKGDRLMQRSVNEAIKGADKAMLEPIEVLTSRTYAFLNNINPRLYRAPGPYWQKDGEGNWYFKDGKGNGISEKIRDGYKVQKIGRILPALAYGYLASSNPQQKEKYAARLVQYCQAFFLDKNTGMLPSMRWANTEGEKQAPYAPVDFEKLVDVVNALSMIEGSQAYTPEFDKNIRRWFAEMADYMANTEHGKQCEKENVGNIATIYELERLAFAVYGGDNTYAAKRWPRIQKLLDEELDSKCRFWRELKRHKPNMYSNKSIQAWFKLFRILAMQGIDPWKWQHNGKSFAKVVEVHNSAMLGEWVMKPGEKIEPGYWLDDARTAQLVYWENAALVQKLERFLGKYDGNFRKGSSDMLHKPYLRKGW